MPVAGRTARVMVSRQRACFDYSTLVLNLQSYNKAADAIVITTVRARRRGDTGTCHLRRARRAEYNALCA